MIWFLNGSEVGVCDYFNVFILKIMLLYGLEVCNKIVLLLVLFLYLGLIVEWFGKWIFNDFLKGLEFVCIEICDMFKNILKYYILCIIECWFINMCIIDVSD